MKLSTAQAEVLAMMPLTIWQKALHRVRRDVLERLTDMGLIVYRDRRVSWCLTPEGRAALRDLKVEG